MGPKSKNEKLWEIEPGVEWGGDSLSEPGPGNQTFYDFSAHGTQALVISEGNPYRKLGKGLKDIGGPFRVVRREMPINISWYVPRNRTNSNLGASSSSNFRGSYHAQYRVIDDSVFPPPSHPLDVNMDAEGTKAIARVMPTNPVSGLAVALGELRREGLPSAPGYQSWRERTLNARNAGSEYLNHQFGWIPLLNEVRDFSHAVTKSDEIIAEYERNSGKLLKRSWTAKPEITITELVETGKIPPEATKSGFVWGYGTRKTVTTVKRELWFEGVFTYYLPPYDPQGNNRKRNEQIANKLFGTRVTPEVLWNLTPWTWAADWISNTGDVLHNISAFQTDGLVMPWGYVMRKRSETRDVTLDDFWVRRYSNTIGPTQAPQLRQVLVTTTKDRRKATPYGFGLNIGSFTNRQWAILTALGLSRSGRSLD